MARSDITYTYYYAGPSDSSDTTVRESDRCGVDGCGKKQCYCEIGDEKTRLYSKYCYHHTCERTFPVEEGYHCAHPKKKEYRYCRDHQKCAEPGCRELGEYRGGHGDPYVPYVCDQHRCTVPHCESLAHDRQQQRCTTHLTKCTVSGCDRPCYLHRDGRLDLACVVHYGNFKCAWAGCTRRKPGYDVKYCLAHKCSIHNCGNGRDPTGGSVCVTHRCSFASCPNAVADPSSPSSLTCLEEHTCRIRGCLLPRSRSSSNSSAPPSSLFCRAHTCGMPGCTREACFPSSRYCAERHACAVAGCAEPRLDATPSASGRASLSPNDYVLPALGGRCAKHAAAAAGAADRERHERRGRAASVDVRVDLDGLRERFDRERKRLSDDVGRMTRLEREREERERRERERGDGYSGYPGWERWYER